MCIGFTNYYLFHVNYELKVESLGDSQDHPAEGEINRIFS